MGIYGTRIHIHIVIPLRKLGIRTIENMDLCDGTKRRPQLFFLFFFATSRFESFIYLGFSKGGNVQVEGGVLIIFPMVFLCLCKDPSNFSN